MRRALMVAAAFLGPLAFAAGIAWIGGFNFDTRGPDVAFFSFLACCAACCVAAFVLGVTHD